MSETRNPAPGQDPLRPPQADGVKAEPHAPNPAPELDPLARHHRREPARQQRPGRGANPRPGQDPLHPRG